ncbi:GNAT family N-acetyltransferase [Pelagibius sp. CAU 1746]|uniref:GNAT family N-acetyltransferase n=1 Tax=Pelagibius sp. CAU 1746 TaxID=3140370 RepID=UPI00325B539E
MTLPDTSADTSIQLVGLDETFELRRAVLRPWMTPAEAAAPYIAADDHFHVGALQGGKVVSTAGFMAEAQPDYTEVFGPAQWRLRGMASDPSVQGKGLGGRVLEFGVEELARRLAARGEDGAVVWCNGRTVAQTFYERHGFQAIGALFETPRTGTHYVFWRKVEVGPSGGI